MRYLKNVRTVNGKREWLIAWAGSQPGGPGSKAWADSWEPTRNIDDELIQDFFKEKKEAATRSILIDVRPLDSHVQRRIAGVVLRDGGKSFGTTHVVPIDALTITGIAEFYMTATAALYGELREIYDPASRRTTRELRISEPEEVAAFSNFHEILGERVGHGCLRYHGGRKSNTDLVVVGVLKLRYVDDKRTPGCVSFEVQAETCKINGRTGQLTPPHQIASLLKSSSHQAKVMQYARDTLASFYPSHYLHQHGWANLPLQATLA